MGNMVFDYRSGGRFSMAAHVASLISVTVAPVSTSFILFLFVSILIWYNLNCVLHSEHGASFLLLFRLRIC